MGTDIFGYLEVKKDDIWKILDDIPIPIDRDYDIFNILFKLYRSPVVNESVSSSCGLPEYNKEELEERLKIYGVHKLGIITTDYHSHTWITAANLIDYNLDVKPDFERDDELTLKEIIYKNENWKTFLLKMIELSKKYGKDEVRVVVWFDVG